MLKNRKGFSIIEISIALVVIGLLVGFGSMGVKLYTKVTKIKETKSNLDSVISEIMTFAKQNDRLPTTIEFPSVAKTVVDSFSGSLRYDPDSLLSSTANGGICERRTTGTTISYLGTTINDVAFLLISGGENVNIQTGSLSPITVHAGGMLNVDDYAADGNNPDKYDDIVRWVTLFEMKKMAGCYGRNLKILDGEIPVGVMNTAYTSIDIKADGGVPFTSGGNYEWCFEGSIPSGMSLSGLTPKADCSATGTTYVKGDDITLSGTPTVKGSYKMKIFARDNDGNSDNKIFILVIQPEAGTGGGGASKNIEEDEKAKLDKLKSAIASYVADNGELPGRKNGGHNSDTVIEKSEMKGAYEDLIDGGYLTDKDFESVLMPGRYFIFIGCTPTDQGFYVRLSREHTNTCLYLSNVAPSSTSAGNEPNMVSVTYRDYCLYDVFFDDKSSYTGDVRRAYGQFSGQSCTSDFDAAFSARMATYTDYKGCAAESWSLPSGDDWCNTIIKLFEW